MSCHCQRLEFVWLSFQFRLYLSSSEFSFKLEDVTVYYMDFLMDNLNEMSVPHYVFSRGRAQMEVANQIDNKIILISNFHERLIFFLHFVFRNIYNMGAVKQIGEFGLSSSITKM